MRVIMVNTPPEADRSTEAGRKVLGDRLVDGQRQREAAAAVGSGGSGGGDGRHGQRRQLWATAGAAARTAGLAAAARTGLGCGEQVGQDRRAVEVERRVQADRVADDRAGHVSGGNGKLSRKSSAFGRSSPARTSWSRIGRSACERLPRCRRGSASMTRVPTPDRSRQRGQRGGELLALLGQHGQARGEGVQRGTRWWRAARRGGRRAGRARRWPGRCRPSARPARRGTCRAGARGLDGSTRGRPAPSSAPG